MLREEISLLPSQTSFNRRYSTAEISPYKEVGKIVTKSKFRSIEKSDIKLQDLKLQKKRSSQNENSNKIKPYMAQSENNRKTVSLAKKPNRKSFGYI